MSSLDDPLAAQPPAQRVQPLVDARDRVATALATTRSELVLEAFDRRLESLGRRLEGLLALRDRLESVSEEVRAVRGSYTNVVGLPLAELLEMLADVPRMANGGRWRGGGGVARAERGLSEG